MLLEDLKRNQDARGEMEMVEMGEMRVTLRHRLVYIKVKYLKYKIKINTKNKYKPIVLKQISRLI